MRGMVGIIEMQYMRKKKVLADITANYENETVSVEVYTDDPVYMPFGINKNPNFDDYKFFLESRCFPKTRHNAKQLLDDLDIQYYEPFYIIQKTHGLLFEDYCWIKFKDEDINYDDIKIRD